MDGTSGMGGACRALTSLRFLSSAAAVVLLASCGGGSGGDSTSDIPDELDSTFAARVQTLSDITGGALVTSGNTSIPTTGTATFTGSGVISDPSIPDAVDTVEGLLDYAFFSADAEATVDFSAGKVSSTMTNFLDAAGSPVTGSIKMENGAFTPGTGVFSGGLAGTVAGTTIVTTQDGAIYGTPSDGAVVGTFLTTGIGGTYDGVTLSGAFAAD